MGKSKTELFTPQQNALANMAKALGHPARIAILEHLIETGSCVCGDLVDKLPLSQATISQHLKAMKQAGLIQGTVEGAFRCYCVDQECCRGVQNSFVKFFSKLTSCC